NTSVMLECFFFSSRRRHTRFSRDWSSDVCSSDLFLALGEDASSPRRNDTETFESAIAGARGIYLEKLHTCSAKGIFLCGREFHRSEERRVGKECRCRWWPEQ